MKGTVFVNIILNKIKHHITAVLLAPKSHPADVQRDRNHHHRIYCLLENIACVMDNALIDAYGDCESSSEEENLQTESNESSTPPKTTNERMTTVAEESTTILKETCNKESPSAFHEPHSHQNANSRSDTSKKRPLTLPTDIAGKLEPIHAKQRRLHGSQSRRVQSAVYNSKSDINSAGTNNRVKETKISRISASTATRKVPKDAFIPPQVATRIPNVPTEDLVAYGLKKTQK